MNIQLETLAKGMSRLSFTPVPTGLLLRTCACGQQMGGGECAECRQKREGTLQRVAVSPSPVNAVPPIVHDVLNSPGQSLDIGTRTFMEPRFGHDFSGVRVHTDARAVESARSVNALAYTVGRNVVFGAGQYAPGTGEGRKLLAHELTHVVQQGSQSVSKSAAVALGKPGDNYEREADIHARNIEGEGFQPGQAPVSMHRASAVMQRTEDAGATPPTPVQAPTPSAWTNSLLAIMLDSDRNNCFGMAVPSGNSPYSDCGSPVKPPFCQSARVPFSVDFIVDRVDAPRPKSLKMPAVSVDFDFVTTDGDHTTHIQKADPAPRYDAPNMPLKPNFGHNFPIGTTKSGTLHVQLIMNDTAAGARVVYTDDIYYDIQPCV